jgi:hypothetical protein
MPVATSVGTREQSTAICQSEEPVQRNSCSNAIANVCNSENDIPLMFIPSDSQVFIDGHTDVFAQNWEEFINNKYQTLGDYDNTQFGPFGNPGVYAIWYGCADLTGQFYASCNEWTYSSANGNSSQTLASVFKYLQVHLLGNTLIINDSFDCSSFYNVYIMCVCW